MIDFDNIRSKDIAGFKSDAHAIRTIDMHTGGEPLRVIIDGYPELQGSSVLDYRNFLKNHHDDLRKSLMWEPRGHADMYGCVLTPPNDAEGDFGIVFMHNEGYSTMCGHAIIAISTLVYKMGWKDAQEGENELKIDAPCGRIQSFTKVENGNIVGVRFIGVPSFVVELDAKVNVPGIGQVVYDLAYGGAFYAYVDMDKNNLDFGLEPKDYQQLISHGMDIKNAVIEHNQSINHPFEVDLSFLYGTIFLRTQLESMESQNVCIFAEGEVDRCPTGSGVMGRVSIHYKRGEINLNEEMAISGIVGSTFKGVVVSSTNYGPFEAIIPQVEGTAFITGQHTFIIDPNDPLKGGFILR